MRVAAGANYTFEIIRYFYGIHVAVHIEVFLSTIIARFPCKRWRRCSTLPLDVSQCAFLAVPVVCTTSDTSVDVFGSSDEQGREPRQPFLVELRLLPALPSEWPDGRFRGLRARGGYEVDVDWEAGEITAAKLRAVPRTVSSVTTKDRRGGEQCRVLSRTQLALVKGESASETELEELDGFYEGGILWHSLRLGPLMADEVVQLIAV